MKTKILIITFVLIDCFSSYSQGFVNLNFESAQPSSFGGNLPYVPATSAILGWTAYVGGVAQTSVIYNTVPLSDAEVTLQGTNGSPYPAILGNYSLMLFGGFNPSQGSFYTNCAAIGQTGQISVATQSLTFCGNIGRMNTTFNGQPINFLVIGSTPNYTIYGANIASFAGQTGQLLFDNPSYGNTTFGGPTMIDNIQFSTSPIPEPSTLALAAFGGLLLGFRRWKK